MGTPHDRGPIDHPWLMHEMSDSRSRGDRSPAKLTPAQRDEIKRRHQEDGASARDLAAEFGVSVSLVRKYL